MRLLNVKTLKLEPPTDRPKYPYAILSHTWENEEVLFHHIENLDRAALEKLQGWPKVKASCAQAEKDGYQYIWNDTCCIDKSSSAELSEAINSMWRFYRESDVCYGFLADVKKDDPETIRKSRWFKRGWTLQELIAPDRLRFFDANWIEMDDRVKMTPLLSEITGIDPAVLSRNHGSGHTHEIQPRTLLCVVCGNPTSIEEILRRTSVAARMSWCAARETTRDEDRAYSLLGLFGANMPLLYGEGGDAAWVRLLEEIIKKTNDQSILAFDSRPRREERAPQSLSTAPSPFRSGIFSEHASRYASLIYPPTSPSTSRMKLVAGDLVLDIWLCPLFLRDAKSSSKQRAVSTRSVVL